MKLYIIFCVVGTYEPHPTIFLAYMETHPIKLVAAEM